MSCSAREGLMFFLFLHKNICYGYSLEARQSGTSNEYPQHMFSWRNKKNEFWILPLTSDLTLCTDTIMCSTKLACEKLLWYFFLVSLGIGFDILCRLPSKEGPQQLARKVNLCFYEEIMSPIKLANIYNCDVCFESIRFWWAWPHFQCQYWTNYVKFGMAAVTVSCVPNTIIFLE